MKIILEINKNKHFRKNLKFTFVYLFYKKFKQKIKTIPILVETNKNKHYEKSYRKRKFSP
jgi:hypothetical protein